MENYIYDDKIKDVVKSEEQVDLFGIRGVTKIVDYQEEAFEFLSWLCGEDGAQIIAGSGNISGYMNDEIQEIYRDSLQGKNADVFSRASACWRVRRARNIMRCSVLLPISRRSICCRTSPLRKRRQSWKQRGRNCTPDKTACP